MATLTVAWLADTSPITDCRPISIGASWREVAEEGGRMMIGSCYDAGSVRGWVPKKNHSLVSLTAERRDSLSTSALPIVLRAKRRPGLARHLFARAVSPRQSSPVGKSSPVVAPVGRRPFAPSAGYHRNVAPWAMWIEMAAAIVTGAYNGEDCAQR